MKHYHFAPKENRHNILRNGLKVMPSNFQNNPDGIYMWTEDPRISIKIKDMGADYKESCGDLWEVDIKEKATFNDLWLPYAVYVVEDIPTTDIKLINNNT